MYETVRDVLGGIAVVIVALMGLRFAVSAMRSEFTVFDYQQSLLFRHGRFVGPLPPGRHVRWGRGWTAEAFDTRPIVQPVANQEVLTADGLTVKITVVYEAAVTDAVRALMAAQSSTSAAYMAVQSALRDAVAVRTGEELLSVRNEISSQLTETCRAPFEALGMRLERIEVRDLIFPGELKRLFAQVVMAQKESQAALERARGEQAALRSLANAARMLENNPALYQLRVLQALGDGKGATVVLHAGNTPAAAPGTEAAE